MRVSHKRVPERPETVEVLDSHYFSDQEDPGERVEVA
jgi:hypothetical protein